jgi:hypothetical protein
MTRYGMTPRRRNGIRPHRIILGSRVARWMGHDGFTFAIWTFIAAPTCDAELRAHENRHVQQCLKLLVMGFWLLYLGEFGVRILVALAVGPRRSAIKHAYRRISWERDAYLWARRHWPEFDPMVRRR